MAILLGATAWTCKTNSAWGVLGAWFFLILAPSSSIIPLDSPAYEHRMYLPLAAVVTGAVVIAFVLGKRLLRNQSDSVLGCVACAFVVVPLAVLTIQRNRDYNSEITIWQDTVEKRPNNPRAFNNLGVALDKAGRIPEAIAHLEHVRTDQARVRRGALQSGKSSGAGGPGNGSHRPLRAGAAAQARVRRGALQSGGRVAEGATTPSRKYSVRSPSTPRRTAIWDVALQEGKIDDAIAQYEQALRIKPDFAEAHCDLGVFLQKG